MNIGKEMGTDFRSPTMIPEEHIVYAYSLPEEIWDANTDLYGDPFKGIDSWGNPIKETIWTFLLKCPHCGTLKIGRSTGVWCSSTICNKCCKIYGVHSKVKNLKIEL
jgi:hypothetical protein